MPDPPISLPLPPGLEVLYNSCTPRFDFGAAGIGSEGCQRNDNALVEVRLNEMWPIPFGYFTGAGFQFFGTEYTNIYVSNNGFISLGQPLLSTPTAGPLPSGTLPPIIAPFWADVDTRILPPPGGVPQNPPGGVVWLEKGRGYLVATWDHVGYYPGHSDRVNTFQVVLTDGTSPLLPEVPGAGGRRYNVGFFYNDMDWATGDGAGGSGGFFGIPAFVGVSGNQQCLEAHCTQEIGRFFQPGNDRIGGGVDWLDWRVIYMDVSGEGTATPELPLPSPSVSEGILALSRMEASLDLGGGDTLLVDPASTIFLPARRGVAPLFEIPDAPQLSGMLFYAQFAMYDPVLFPADPLQLSNGVRVAVGVQSGFPASSTMYGSGGSEIVLGLAHIPNIGRSVMFHFAAPGM